MTPRMAMGYTRSGIGPVIVPDAPERVVLPIAWYAPKPAWMDHIPGPFMRFRNRAAFDHWMLEAAGGNRR